MADELLRYDSPVQMSRRVTLADYEIDGHRIEAGTLLMTCLGSANRDPAKWGDTADALDLRPRRCATSTCRSAAASTPASARTSPASKGARRSRRLVRRFPNLELATDQLEWNGRIVLRGLNALPLTIS